MWGRDPRTPRHPSHETLIPDTASGTPLPRLRAHARSSVTLCRQRAIAVHVHRSLARRRRCLIVSVGNSRPALPAPIPSSMTSSSRILRVGIKNYRSLADVDLSLGPLNVLVGPNGAGKSNLLSVFRFLASLIRLDLAETLESVGGMENLLFRGQASRSRNLSVELEAIATQYSSTNATDVYELTLRGPRSGRVVLREESFRFKRTQGQGRRITIRGDEVLVQDEVRGRPERESRFGISERSLGLSTLPRLAENAGGKQVREFNDLLSSFIVFDVNVAAARQPSRLESSTNLRADASNLADFLRKLAEDEEAWELLKSDARRVLPQLRDIDFELVGGSAPAVAVRLHEYGLSTPTYLADASFGTVRLLGLLALMYDPDPPPLTCIEEIDHGLHPQAFDLIVQLLRDASARSQFLVTTHSPAVVNRLRPEELVVCERREDGSSAIPAISSQVVQQKEAATLGRLRLGELWFAGALGGGLDRK